MPRKRDEPNPREGMLCSREGLLGTGEGILCPPRGREALTPARDAVPRGRRDAVSSSHSPTRSPREAVPSRGPAPVPPSPGGVRDSPPGEEEPPNTGAVTPTAFGQGWTSRVWEWAAVAKKMMENN